MARNIKSTDELVLRSFLDKLVGDERQPEGIEESMSPLDFVPYEKVGAMGVNAMSAAAKSQALKNLMKDSKQILGNEVGALGDWQKHGITFKHTPGEEIHNIKAVNPNGKVVGDADFQKTFSGYYPMTVEVSPEMQRKGIASEMYRLQEEKSGSKIMPSFEQSDDAMALWNNPNRPFGPEESLADLQGVADRNRIEAANARQQKYLNDHPEYKAKLLADLENQQKNDAERYITKKVESVDADGNKSTSYTHAPNPNWKPIEYNKPDTSDITLTKEDLMRLGMDEASAEEEYAKQFINDKFSSLKKKLKR